jgi:Hemerythrin HHE cation binding domain
MTTSKRDRSAIDGTASGILDTHRRIREMARELEETRDLVTLLARLHAFRSVLVAHFLEEETPGGLFDLIRESRSRHLGRVGEFEQEHGAFLDQIDGLADRSRACLAGPVAEILRLAGQLVGRVRDHETRENDILLDTLYEEVGQGD